MTEAEVQICRELIPRFSPGRDKEARIRNFLIQMDRSHESGHGITDFHRRWLIKVAWEYRHLLSGRLAVIVALKRG